MLPATSCLARVPSEDRSEYASLLDIREIELGAIIKESYQDFSRTSLSSFSAAIVCYDATRRESLDGIAEALR